MGSDSGMAGVVGVFPRVGQVVVVGCRVVLVVSGVGGRRLGHRR